MLGNLLGHELRIWLWLSTKEHKIHINELAQKKEKTGKDTEEQKEKIYNINVHIKHEKINLASLEADIRRVLNFKLNFKPSRSPFSNITHRTFEGFR